MPYGKKEGVLYFGIPSGSLNEQVLRLLAKSGRPLKKSRQYELSGPYDKDVVFRVLDRKEMAQKVSDGIVDCGITGKDYIFEAGREQEVEVLGDFIFSNAFLFVIFPQKNYDLVYKIFCSYIDG